jgi:WD40 repeat protein
MAVLEGHQGEVDRATFSPKGDRVLTAARDGTARIWAAGSGEQILVLRQSGEVHTAQFSPDGNRVLMASTSSDPTIWDAQTGARIVTVPSFRTIYATFSPNGRSFAVGDDNRVQFWSAADGKQIGTLSAKGYPASVAFSPDGSRILTNAWSTYTYDAQSRLWDVSSGKEIAILGGYRSDTHCGSFSPDGKAYWNYFHRRCGTVLGWHHGQTALGARSGVGRFDFDGRWRRRARSGEGELRIQS